MLLTVVGATEPESIEGDGVRNCCTSAEGAGKSVAIKGIIGGVSVDVEAAILRLL